MPGGNVQVTLEGLRRVRIEEVLSTEPYISARVTCPEEQNGDPERGSRARREDLEVAPEPVPARQDLPARAGQHLQHEPGRPRALRRHRRVHRPRPARDQAGNPGDARRPGAARRGGRGARLRGRAAQRRRGRGAADQRADGEEPARVLPPPAAHTRSAGSSARTIPRKSWCARSSSGRRGSGCRGTCSRWCRRRRTGSATFRASSQESGVIRNYIDWLLSLPWAHGGRDRDRPGRGARRLDEEHFGLEKVKERILEYLAVLKLKKDLQRTGALLRRPSRDGQDLARRLDRARDGARVRSHERRRRARRGGDPRPPSHLHRVAAREDHPEPPRLQLEQPGLHDRRDRQDGARRRRATPRPRSSRSWTPSRTPTSSTTTSRSRSISRRRFHHDGERARLRAARAAGPPGGHPDPGLHGRGEARDRPPAPDPARGQGARAGGDRHRVRRRGAREADPRVHARGGRAAAGARDRQLLPEGRAAAHDGLHRELAVHGRGRREDHGPAVHPARPPGGARRGRAWRRDSRGPPRAATSSSSRRSRCGARGA